jgi:hypothetical protein
VFIYSAPPTGVAGSPPGSFEFPIPLALANYYYCKMQVQIQIVLLHHFEMRRTLVLSISELCCNGDHTTCNMQVMRKMQVLKLQIQLYSAYSRRCATRGERARGMMGELVTQDLMAGTAGREAGTVVVGRARSCSNREGTREPP